MNLAPMLGQHSIKRGESNMKIKIAPKGGVTLEDAMNTLVKIANEHQRIEKDLHTNKFYELRRGRMWFKGDGVGVRWELYCNSRDAQKDARGVFGYDA